MGLSLGDQTVNETTMVYLKGIYSSYHHQHEHLQATMAVPDDMLLYGTEEQHARLGSMEACITSSMMLMPRQGAFAIAIRDFLPCPQYSSSMPSALDTDQAMILCIMYSKEEPGSPIQGQPKDRPKRLPNLGIKWCCYPDPQGQSQWCKDAKQRQKLILRTSVHKSKHVLENYNSLGMFVETSPHQLRSGLSRAVHPRLLLIVPQTLTRVYTLLEEEH